MCWAAKRKTTRTEDIAYCLLGLFSVNVPLLYGEGMSAFRRLQEQILMQNEDYSIFMWSIQTKNSHSIPLSSLGDAQVLWPDNFRGALAPHPKQFSALYTKTLTYDLQGARSEFDDACWKYCREFSVAHPTGLPTDVVFEKFTQSDECSNPPYVTSRGLRLRVPMRYSKGSGLPTLL